jgi:hypothetical protein
LLAALGGVAFLIVRGTAEKEKAAYSVEKPMSLQSCFPSFISASNVQMMSKEKNHSNQFCALNSSEKSGGKLKKNLPVSNACSNNKLRILVAL